jgi:hypothetical protein
MPDEQENPTTRAAGLIQDFVAQLRGITQELERLSGLGDHLPKMPGGLPLPSVRNLPLPGALSAEQLSAIATSVTAQRRSIKALETQLSAFDQQLAVLERIVDPLAEWSRAWAELEQRLLHARGGPAAEDQGEAG